MKSPHSAFTLIELLVVIAIIAVLSVVVVLSLNPSELLRQSRDTNRLSDMDTLNHALSVYSVDQSGTPSFFMGSSSVVYVSLPDSSSTCGTWSLPTLPTGYTYACAASTTLKNTNGTGWIPVPLANTSGGSPVGNLPIDPTNQSSSRLYYTYTTNGTQYELTTNLESFKYKLGGPSDQISGDGGTLAAVYEKGSKLGLEPLDYGDKSLTGLWTFEESTGTMAYDYSGNNASGTWSGAQPYYTSGRIGNYAGQFSTAAADGISVSSGTIPFNTPTTFTIMAWVNLTNITGTNWDTPIVAGGGFAFALTRDNHSGTNTRLWCYAKNGTSANISLASTGTWYHVAYTYDGANLIIYVNGAQSSVTPMATTTVSINNLTIGKTGQQFDGLIDNIRVYNRALSASEIAAMYNGGK